MENQEKLLEAYDREKRKKGGKKGDEKGGGVVEHLSKKK